MSMTQANQRQAVSDFELNGIARLFAGEGNITITSGKCPVVYAGMGNSEKILVKPLHILFGGSFAVEKPKDQRNRFMFRWRVSGNDALPFMKAIQPFLIGEKLPQLENAVALQEYKHAAPTKNGYHYTEAALEVMKGFYLKHKELQRAAAETNRRDAASMRNDSPCPEETQG